MASSVRTFLPVVGIPRALACAFEGDPQAWLPGPRRDGGEARWAVPVRAGALTHVVHLSIGSTWQSGNTRWRALSWEPGPDHGDVGAVERMLPGFDGELGLHVLDEDRVTLILDGWYQPPGGVLGHAADAVGLRRVARATMTRFLTEVAARLTAESVLYADAVAVENGASAPDTAR